MRVLVACEFSGIVREAFKAKGHDAWSCDLLPTEIPGQHIQSDVLEILNNGWDMMIAHPPCTDLCVSGAKHFDKKRQDGRQDRAIYFFAQLLFYPIKKICVENPVGVVSTIIRKPDQIIQPYEYGDPFQKTTCLWLKNLPKLQPICNDYPLFAESLNKGEFYISPKGSLLPKWMSDPVGKDGKKLSYNSEEIKKLRSKTFPGIAKAMADQWGSL